jgi:REP element-mobilizing transposase RayT
VLVRFRPGAPTVFAKASAEKTRASTAKGERGIRQRRYWEHTIRDESDFARHMDCIHINPVKHGRESAIGRIRRSIVW